MQPSESPYFNLQLQLLYSSRRYGVRRPLSTDDSLVRADLQTARKAATTRRVSRIPPRLRRARLVVPECGDGTRVCGDSGHNVLSDY